MLLIDFCFALFYCDENASILDTLKIWLHPLRQLRLSVAVSVSVSVGGCECVCGCECLCGWQASAVYATTRPNFCRHFLLEFIHLPKAFGLRSMQQWIRTLRKVSEFLRWLSSQILQPHSTFPIQMSIPISKIIWLSLVLSACWILRGVRSVFAVTIGDVFDFSFCFRLSSSTKRNVDLNHLKSAFISWMFKSVAPGCFRNSCAPCQRLGRLWLWKPLPTRSTFLIERETFATKLSKTLEKFTKNTHWRDESIGATFIDRAQNLSGFFITHWN
jgi:hypothetical protein